MHRLIVFLTALLLLPTIGPAQGNRTISGQVTYLDRMALPDDAVLLVEVLGTDGRLLGDVRLPTNGQQVPFPFAIGAPAQSDVILRAGIMLGFDLVWLGDPVLVVDSAVSDLRLDRYQPRGFTTTFRCGNLSVQTGFAGDLLVMDTGAARLVLDPVPAASGARYQAGADTYFWNKGDTALVALDGRDLPECRISLPPLQTVYPARGNEPAWSVSVAGGVLTLARSGMDDLTLPVTDAALRANGAIVMTATDSDRALRAVLERAPVICRDTMTGLPYPETVSLSMGDATLTGCGGSSASLLQKRTWQVVQLSGEDVPASTPATLGFDPGGRVAGASGCNRWFATYQLSGEALNVRQSGATMMACPDPTMAQERRFFAALAQVTGFDIDGTGGLVLLGVDGPVITARPAMDGSAP